MMYDMIWMEFMGGREMDCFGSNSRFDWRGWERSRQRRDYRRMDEDVQITITATSYRVAFALILIGWTPYAAFSQIILDLKRNFRSSRKPNLKKVEAQNLTNKGTIELAPTTPSPPSFPCLFSSLSFYSR